METVTVWDAYHSNQFTGKLLKRYDKGVTVELRNGTIYYAINANIVEAKDIR